MLKKPVWVNQKPNRFCSSTDSATLLAVDENSFPAMLNKTKTYFFDVVCDSIFYLFSVFHWMV